jgi:hypothetical protein
VAAPIFPFVASFRSVAVVVAASRLLVRRCALAITARDFVIRAPQ